MSRALRAFMTRMVDYAGLFPPAELNVAAAVSTYAKHCGEPEAWMLGRFIAPAVRLAEIGARPELAQGDARPWEFSALVGSRESAAESLAALTSQAALIRQFENLPGSGSRVAGLEAPLLASASPADVAEFLARLLAEGLEQRDVFLEIMPDGDDERVAAASASAASKHASGFRIVGAKLRCGGVTPDAFPSCERVALVIHHCARLELPLKCTAGLHHPLRHWDAALAVTRHGFLNVFGACLLARSGVADLALLTECVSDMEPVAFRFDGECFAWRGHRVDVATIEKLRASVLCGFGSCSFVEPRADLREMGLL